MIICPVDYPAEVHFTIICPVVCPAEVHFTTIFALRNGKIFEVVGMAHPQSPLNFIPEDRKSTASSYIQSLMKSIIFFVERTYP